MGIEIRPAEKQNEKKSPNDSNREVRHRADGRPSVFVIDRRPAFGTQSSRVGRGKMLGDDRATTTTTTTATTKIVGSSRRHFVVPSPFCCRSIHSTCVVVNERFSLHRRAAFVYEQRHFIGREDRQKPVVVRLGGNQATVRMGRRGGGIMIIIFNLKRKDERNRVKAD